MQLAVRRALCAGVGCTPPAQHPALPACDARTRRRSPAGAAPLPPPLPCRRHRRQVGDFGGDNRAGIDATLHRISCLRNRGGRIVGLTCRVGRAIRGSAVLVADLVAGGASVLFMGRPGEAEAGSRGGGGGGGRQQGGLRRESAHC